MVLLAALLVHLAAAVGLALLVEPVPTWYYHLAWWSFIVAVDDLNRRRTGRSLLRDRPWHFGALALVSVLWWALFELLNLRLGNWYYVMSVPSPALRWAGGVAAFATVLPGIVEVLTLVESLGWPARVRVTPLAWTPSKERATLALGAASLLLPLVWPDVFYPLAWGSVAFLLEPLNRRFSRKSFLRDLERGEAGPFCRTLLAGLLCGALWEAWNFWARMKWVYTIPVLDRLRVFEMPILGFLGFPPFAVECLVALRLLGTVGDRLRVRERPRATAAVLLAGALAANAIFAVVDPVTVDSFQVPTRGLRSLAPEIRAGLLRAGLASPERAARALSRLGDPGPRASLEARTGLDAAALAAARDRIALVVHRGLGDARAVQLAGVGVRRVSDLAGWSPEGLAAALRARGAQAPRDRFLERRARVWIDGARPLR